MNSPFKTSNQFEKKLAITKELNIVQLIYHIIGITLKHKNRYLGVYIQQDWQNPFFSFEQ